MLIDSHTHLFDQQFNQDLDTVIQRAKESGIQKFILPAVDSTDYEYMFQTYNKYADCCYATMGLHPTSINNNDNWKEELLKVRQYLENPPVPFIAIGEIGLDLHWSQDFLAQQIEALEYQINLSIEFDLPLIIHTRDAWNEILPIIEKYAGKIRGVFHSFAGTMNEVQRIEEIGNFMYGINGTITYKKSTLPTVVAEIPTSKLLLETDSPYLPPVPYRGKRNESSHIALIADFVANLKGITIEELATITTNNTQRLFNI